MAAFAKLIAFLGKKGTKYVTWAWANKAKVIEWLNLGIGIEWVFSKIKAAMK